MKALKVMAGFGFILIGYIIGVTPVITSIHEIGHILAATLVGYGGEWINSTLAGVSYGNPVSGAIISMAGHWAVFLTGFLLIRVGRKKGIYLALFAIGFVINEIMSLIASASVPDGDIAGLIGEFPIFGTLYLFTFPFIIMGIMLNQFRKFFTFKAKVAQQHRKEITESYFFT